LKICQDIIKQHEFAFLIFINKNKNKYFIIEAIALIIFVKTIIYRQIYAGVSKIFYQFDSADKKSVPD
jgi:hypothetical protein